MCLRLRDRYRVSFYVFERTAHGPHVHFFDAALVKHAGELTRRRPRGHHIVEQGDMPIVVRLDVEGSAQIPSPLSGTEPGLLRSGSGSAQQPGVARDAGDLAEGDGDLFCLRHMAHTSTFSMPLS